MIQIPIHEVKINKFEFVARARNVHLNSKRVDI
jgi:hypothetical protein